MVLREQTAQRCQVPHPAPGSEEPRVQWGEGLGCERQPGGKGGAEYVGRRGGYKRKRGEQTAGLLGRTRLRRKDPERETDNSE